MTSGGENCCSKEIRENSGEKKWVRTGCVVVDEVILFALVLLLSVGMEILAEGENIDIFCCNILSRCLTL